MQLYDTARRAIVPFEPDDHVLMYTCGITPYDATHLGHAATFVTYDVLQRRLIDLGHTVRCVRNVTDVDDPMFAQGPRSSACTTSTSRPAKRPGSSATWWRSTRSRSPLRLARRRRSPTSAASSAWCSTAGTPTSPVESVYFDVSKFESFGSLSHYTDEEMLVLAKERGGNIDDPNKRSPLDFVLWHPSADDEPSWDTHVGAGSSRVAHRVLGAGAARARHHDRPARRRQPT